MYTGRRQRASCSSSASAARIGATSSGLGDQHRLVPEPCVGTRPTAHPTPVSELPPGRQANVATRILTNGAPTTARKPILRSLHRLCRYAEPATTPVARRAGQCVPNATRKSSPGTPTSNTADRDRVSEADVRRDGCAAGGHGVQLREVVRDHLWGVPAPGTGNDYFITITATNSQGTDTEPYDLTVFQTPVFASNFCPGPMTVGQYTHDDDQSDIAYPPFFGLDENNSLPSGISFNQDVNNEDAGVLSGTPEPGTGGNYGLQYSSDANNTTRNLHCKLVVDEAPTFTDSAAWQPHGGRHPNDRSEHRGRPGFRRWPT